MPKNVWYSNITYNWGYGVWLKMCGMQLWADTIYVQDNYGNLVITNRRVYFHEIR